MKVMPGVSILLVILVFFSSFCIGNAVSESQGGEDWALGICAWSFKNYSFFEAVEKTADLGLKNIEAYQGQKIYEDRDLKLGPELGDFDIAKITGHLNRHGVRLRSIYIHKFGQDDENCIKVFDFCRKLGVKTIVGEPKAEDLDRIEKFCEDYGINVAIHNHATGKSNYSDPNTVAKLCAGRSKLVGACADTGHWQRSGYDAVECLKVLEGRIISVHLKDLNKSEPSGHDVVWGTGVGRIADTLAELCRQKVEPTIIGIEYEYHWDKSEPEIAGCVEIFGKVVTDLKSAGDLYAGWSQKDITPAGAVALDGQMKLRVSKSVLDPITCTALAIETRCGGESLEQTVMVSCDVVSIREPLLAELDKRKAYIESKAKGIDTAKIFLNATHTHTAPVMNEGKYAIPADIIQPGEYCRFMADKVAEAVIEAWNGRKTSSVSWALGQAVVGHNRRCVYSEPYTTSFGTFTAAMYGKTNLPIFRKIEGYEDHGLPMLFFWDGDGKLIGMVLNLCCPSQETEGIRHLSADFWHDTRVEIRKRFGKELFILPQCSAAGDISPHHIWRKPAEVAMQKRKGISQRQEIALRIADAVEEVMPWANYDAKSYLVFKHAVNKVDLPVLAISKEDRDFSFEMAEKMRETKPRMAQWYQGVVDRYETQATDVYPIEFHTMRLGDVAIASNTFELYVDYGIQIKTKSPGIVTFVVQLAGRGPGSPYLPTQAALEGGHYSAVPQSNIVGPAGGQKLVEKTVESLAGMWTVK
jgi:sugar phosphate isomerase/epimerase